MSSNTIALGLFRLLDELSNRWFYNSEVLVRLTFFMGFSIAKGVSVSHHAKYAATSWLYDTKQLEMIHEFLEFPSINCSVHNSVLIYVKISWVMTLHLFCQVLIRERK